MNISQWKNGDRTFFSLRVDDRLLLVRAWDADDVLLYEDRDFCNLYSTNYFENVSWCLSRHLLQCTVFKTERRERKIESLGILQITANLILTIWLFCVYGPKTPRPQPNKHSGHDTWAWPTCNLILTCALPTCCHIPIISRSFGNKKKWWLLYLFHKGIKKNIYYNFLTF